MAFFEGIESQVKDLDIGLVVLNAGVSVVGSLASSEDIKLQEMMDTNVYQVVGMLEKFKKRLESRKTRSGMIVLSSIAAQLPGLPTSVTYGATKVFVKYLAVAMDMAGKTSGSKVDMLCL